MAVANWPLKEGEQSAERWPLKEGEQSAEPWPVKEGEQSAERWPLNEGEQSAERWPLKEGEQSAERWPLKVGSKAQSAVAVDILAQCVFVSLSGSRIAKNKRMSRCSRATACAIVAIIEAKIVSLLHANAH